MWTQVQVRMIGNITSGVSQTTGKTWNRQTVLVAWPERDANNAPAKMLNGDPLCNYLNIDLFGVDVERFAALQLQPGRWMWIDLRFSVATSKTGNPYNSIRVLDIAAITPEQQPQVPMPPIAVQAANNAPAPAAPVAHQAPAPAAPQAPAAQAAYPPHTQGAAYQTQPLPFD